MSQEQKREKMDESLRASERPERDEGSGSFHSYTKK
jgi:hypothetical protein